MKQLIKTWSARICSLLLCLMMAVTMANAQSAADKICGNYKVVRNGVTSKVKVFKNGKGYRAQVYWVDNLKNADGTTKTDSKNPDKAKRNTPADQIILINNVTYNAEYNTWENGQIYDSTSGKTYKVKLWFDSDKVLKMRGYLGIFHDTSEWIKI